MGCEGPELSASGASGRRGGWGPAAGRRGEGGRAAVEGE